MRPITTLALTELIAFLAASLVVAFVSSLCERGEPDLTEWRDKAVTPERVK